MAVRETAVQNEESTEMSTEEEPERETEIETGAKLETETETESELETETETESETEPETESETEIQTIFVEAAAQGFGGEIKICVEKGLGGYIHDIQLLDLSTETDTIGQVAAKQMVKNILREQRTEVDGVTGATITCNAVKEAVTAALAK